jgi:hypothetical protein
MMNEMNFVLNMSPFPGSRCKSDDSSSACTPVHSELIVLRSSTDNCVAQQPLLKQVMSMNVDNVDG